MSQKVSEYGLVSPTTGSYAIGYNGTTMERYDATAFGGGGTGTVTSVNNIAPVAGNVTLTATDVGASEVWLNPTPEPIGTHSRIIFCQITNQADIQSVDPTTIVPVYPLSYTYVAGDEYRMVIEPLDNLGTLFMNTGTTPAWDNICASPFDTNVVLVEETSPHTIIDESGCTYIFTYHATQKNYLIEGSSSSMMAVSTTPYHSTAERSGWRGYSIRGRQNVICNNGSISLGSAPYNTNTTCGLIGGGLYNDGGGTVQPKGWLLTQAQYNSLPPNATGGAVGQTIVVNGTQTGYEFATPVDTSTFVRVLSQSGAASAAATGDINEHTLLSYTLPANTMGANSSLRISMMLAKTGTAGTMTARCYFGGVLAIDAATSSASSTISHTQTMIRNKNSKTAQAIPRTNGVANGVGSGFSAYSAALFTNATIDTTADVTISFAVVNANSGDSTVLQGYTIELLP